MAYFEIENKSHRKFSSIIFSLTDIIPFEMITKLFKILPDRKSWYTFKGQINSQRKAILLPSLELSIILTAIPAT